jgi:hypothetical protein
MNDWPTDDSTAADLAREADYFARVDAAEAWAAEIERLALLEDALADGLDGDDDPDGAVARHYDRWAA